MQFNKTILAELVGGPRDGATYQIHDQYVMSINMPYVPNLASWAADCQPPHRMNYAVYRVRQISGQPVVSQRGHLLFDYAGIEP